MKIEIAYSNGIVEIAAIDTICGAVAHVKADTLIGAVKALVSRFAEMQKATIEALNASGVVHYTVPVSQENMS